MAKLENGEKKKKFIEENEVGGGGGGGGTMRKAELLDEQGEAKVKHRVVEGVTEVELWRKWDECICLMELENQINNHLSLSFSLPSLLAFGACALNVYILCTLCTRIHIYILLWKMFANSSPPPLYLSLYAKRF